MTGAEYIAVAAAIFAFVGGFAFGHVAGYARRGEAIRRRIRRRARYRRVGSSK